LFDPALGTAAVPVVRIGVVTLAARQQDRESIQRRRRPGQALEETGVGRRSEPKAPGAVCRTHTRLVEGARDRRRTTGPGERYVRTDLYDFDGARWALWIEPPARQVDVGMRR